MMRKISTPCNSALADDSLKFRSSSVPENKLRNRILSMDRGCSGFLSSQFQSTVSAYVTIGAMPSFLETFTKGTAMVAGIVMGSLGDLEGWRGGRECT